MSGRSAPARRIPSSPLSASTTLWPAANSSFFTRRRLLGSSSIWGPRATTQDDTTRPGFHGYPAARRAGVCSRGCPRERSQLPDRQSVLGLVLAVVPLGLIALLGL